MDIVYSNGLCDAELLVGAEIDTGLRFELQLRALQLVSDFKNSVLAGNITFDAATCNVKPETGKEVLLDIRDWINRDVSVSLEMLKRTLTLVFVTVTSFEVSGTEEAKFHSSSSLAALVLCAKFVVGAAISPPSKSIVPEAGAGGLTDC